MVTVTPSSAPANACSRAPDDGSPGSNRPASRTWLMTQPRPTVAVRVGAWRPARRRVSVEAGTGRTRRCSHSRRADSNMLTLSRRVLTFEPAWSTQIVGTSSMRSPNRPATASRSTSMRKSRDDRNGNTCLKAGPRSTLAPHCVSAVRQPEQHADSRHERPARQPAAPAAGRRRERCRVSPRCDRPVGTAWPRPAAATAHAAASPHRRRRRPPSRRHSTGTPPSARRPCRASGRRGTERGRPRAACAATTLAVRSQHPSIATMNRTDGSVNTIRYVLNVRSIRRSSLCAGMTISRVTDVSEWRCGSMWCNSRIHCERLRVS